MKGQRQQFLNGSAAAGARSGALVLSLALAAAAVAAPPPGRGTSVNAQWHTGNAGGGRFMSSALHANADRAMASKLDLRAPAEIVSGSGMAGELRTVSGDTPAFPSFRHDRLEATPARLEEQLPSLGAVDLAMRPMSRAEQLATRFRREGLPVARLFESRTALVSLGLSQRGKPGIWLIQKLP